MWDGRSNGSSGSSFYMTNKEFSNISNHPYSGRAPLQVQHRNSNDSWPSSPTSLKGGAPSYGVGLDLKEEKNGYSNRLSSSSNSHHNNNHHHHHATNNHHHHQYNQYHRISSGANHHQQQQQQQFNCNYMNSSSNSRGRLSVHTNGYYDSMSSKLIVNSQNNNGGHFDSKAQSYSLSLSSSIGMKSYRELKNEISLKLLKCLVLSFPGDLLILN